VRGELPDDVLRLIAAHIDSISLLDVLLLMRAAPDRSWSPPEVARALVTTEEMARDQLAKLRKAALAREAEGAYTYAPDARWEAAVDGLAEEYARRRHVVIATVYGADRGPASTLADAFKLRKRDRDR